MAPYDGNLAMAPPQNYPAPPPHHSTLQWHPAMAPRSLPQSWPHHSTLQWHPAMAPHPLPQSWSSPPRNGTLVARPIRQSGSSPSPPIGSKNPYSYRYLGKKGAIKDVNLLLLLKRFNVRWGFWVKGSTSELTKRWRPSSDQHRPTRLLTIHTPQD